MRPLAPADEPGRGVSPFLTPWPDSFVGGCTHAKVNAARQQSTLDLRLGPDNLIPDLYEAFFALMAHFKMLANLPACYQVQDVQRLQ